MTLGRHREICAFLTQTLLASTMLLASPIAMAQTAPALPTIQKTPPAKAQAPARATEAAKRATREGVGSPSASLRQPPSKVTTDFYNAFMAGNLELADMLLSQGADINCGNCGRFPVLFYALPFSLTNYGGSNNHISWLLARGANPNLVNVEGETAFSFFVSGISVWGGSLTQLSVVSDQQLLAWLKAFLDAGAQLKAGRTSGETPLHLLAQMIQIIYPTELKLQARYLPLMEELLRRGADINARAAVTGYTPLMLGLKSGVGMSASACNPDLVSFFLSHGADPTLTGKDGKSAYDVALERAAGGAKACNALLPLLKSAAVRPAIVSGSQGVN